jgi:hypothetical protein
MRAAKVATFTTTGAPEPFKQCDGSWRVPMWSPKAGWELGDWDPEGAIEFKSRSECRIPGCEAIHTEDIPAIEARIRRDAAKDARVAAQQASH